MDLKIDFESLWKNTQLGKCSLCSDSRSLPEHTPNPVVFLDILTRKVQDALMEVRVVSPGVCSWSERGRASDPEAGPESKGR